MICRLKTHGGKEMAIIEILDTDTPQDVENKIKTITGKELFFCVKNFGWTSMEEFGHPGRFTLLCDKGWRGHHKTFHLTEIV
jgi:hypothetical protein